MSLKSGKRLRKVQPGGLEPRALFVLMTTNSRTPILRADPTESHGEGIAVDSPFPELAVSIFRVDESSHGSSLDPQAKDTLARRRGGRLGRRGAKGMAAVGPVPFPSRQAALRHRTASIADWPHESRIIPRTGPSAASLRTNNSLRR